MKALLLISLFSIVLNIFAGDLWATLQLTYDLDYNAKGRLIKKKEYCYFDKSRVLMDITFRTDKRSILIKEDKMFYINHAKKLYSELKMERYEGSHNPMKTRMSEVYKHMTPKQRAISEKYLVDDLNASSNGKKNKVVYKEVGKKVFVERWNCQKFVGYYRGKRVTEFCILPWKRVKIKPKDVKNLEFLFDYKHELSADHYKAMRVANILDSDGAFNGLPILFVKYNGAVKLLTKTLKHIKKINKVPETWFNLPRSFEKKLLSRKEI